MVNRCKSEAVRGSGAAAPMLSSSQSRSKVDDSMVFGCCKRVAGELTNPWVVHGSMNAVMTTRAKRLELLDWNMIMNYSN